MTHDRQRLTPCIASLLALLIAAAAPAADSLDDVQRRTVAVPMRDGVELATDIYQLPTVHRAPVLLMRTPYNKARGESSARRYAAAGYIAVVQDCRGRFESKGSFVPYDAEGQDGFDAIEWIQRQKWCSGRIGMWGASYVGATQWQAAVEQPPGLVTIAPTATWSSFYRNLYLGGAVRLSLIAGWAAGNSDRPEGVSVNSNWRQTLLHLPLSEVDRQIGWPIPWLRGMLTHPRHDGYWNRVELADEIVNLRLPIQHVVGYYDFFSRESVDNFVAMRERATDAKTRRHQQLILGPWDHGTIGRRKVGDVDFGPEAEVDWLGENLAWFDRYLKQHGGEDSGVVPAVRYFSMGENVWKTAPTWPPPGFAETGFYLHSKGNAASTRGNGTLDENPPTDDELPDVFLADPSAPTPACPITPERPLMAATWAPIDQRTLESREDVLVYTSSPFSEPLTFAGNARAELAVSSDTKDADWVVKLVDVHPNGFAQNLAVGILRGSFRNSEQSPQPLEADKVYRITIDLGPVAAQLQPGHRLRVDVCGAYFPLFDRNTNTANGPFSRETAIAKEVVYHDKARVSRIVLPCRR